MQHLSLIFGGLAVVMGVLTLLWGATALVGRLFAARPPADTALPVPAPIPATVSTAAVPPHHVAAIAAAVAVVTGGRGRVVRVAAATPAALAWVQQGRAELFASHRLHAGWPASSPTSGKGPEAKS